MIWRDEVAEDVYCGMVRGIFEEGREIELTNEYKNNLLLRKVLARYYKNFTKDKLKEVYKEKGRLSEIELIKKIANQVSFLDYLESKCEEESKRIYSEYDRTWGTRLDTMNVAVAVAIRDRLIYRGDFSIFYKVIDKERKRKFILNF